MAGKVTTKTFSGGMNKDIDFSLLKDNQYYDALNMKLIADDDANSFALENADGNTFWVSIPAIIRAQYHIVGHCFIHPYLVLFATSNKTTREPNGGTSVIIRITVDKDELQDIDVIYDDSSVSGTLNFSDTYPIEAVGYYEAPDNIKVYWTDGYNPVRGCNIMDPNLDTYIPGMLDLTPDFPYESGTDIRATIEGLTVGRLKACSVQYTYQYYINKGSQTLFAPPTPLQPIPTNDNIYYMGQYEGGDVDEVTGYGVKLSIDVPASNLYNRVRVVAIQYNEYNGIPQVRVIDELNITPSTAQTLNVTDTGNLITELLYEDVAISNSATYTAKTLAIKDNRLFVGNITENFFDVDFDARAYRHNASGSGAFARIYEGDLSTYADVKNAGGYDYTFSQVPEDHDCINRFNDPDQEATLVYQYQSDGSTLGATGTNIEIEFDASTDIAIDTLGVSSTTTETNNITANGADDDLYDAGNRSFHRQEVYRLGVIFRNSKLQSSPVKWIGDIKMPNYTDGSFTHLVYNAGTTTVSARLLGLTVTLSNMPSDAVSWELVYVPRGSDDRSILGQGIIQPNYDRTSYFSANAEMYPEDITGVTNVDYEDVVFFESPEVSFNKNLKHTDADYYQKIGYFPYSTADNRVDQTATYEYRHYKLDAFTAEGDYTANYKNDIDASLVLTYDTNIGGRYTLSTNEVSSFINDTGAYYGPTTTVVASEQDDFHSDFIDPSASASDYVVAANYKRNVFASQYGGLTYNDRQRNTYILASDPVIGAGSVTTYEGDTIIDYFHYTKRCVHLPYVLAGSGNTWGSTHLFPVETSILTRMSNSPYLSRHLTSHRHRLVQEISGTWEGEIPIGGTSYIYNQDTELYRYNSVYSQLNTTNIMIADSEVFDTNDKFPTRILASDEKINNETLDSFTQLRVNNFIDLDGNKGQLYNLEVFKNKLLFWQNSGFGVASVNTRSLIQDGNLGALSLGTGGVLDRYDYISDSIGNQSQFGIAKSRVALYWGDSNKNELFKYDEGLKSLGKLKGMQTWINGKGRIGEIHAVFDHKYNDVIFTITFSRVLECVIDSGDYATYFELDSEEGLSTYKKYNCIVNANYDLDEDIPYRNVLEYTTTGGSPANAWELHTSPYGEDNSGGTPTEYYVTIIHDPANTHTITYNEIADGWVGRNSFTPGRYIELDTNFLSTNDYLILYKHNDRDANRSEYYGVEYDSEVTTVFNKDYPYTKVWDALKWDSKSVDVDYKDQFKDTFSKVSIYTDYQHTGDRSLYYHGDTPSGTRPTEIVRRERTWAMHVPRNIVNDDVADNPDIFDSANWDVTQEFKERMRNKWLLCNFVYDNASNNTFSVSFISAIYRLSRR